MDIKLSPGVKGQLMPLINHVNSVRIRQFDDLHRSVPNFNYEAKILSREEAEKINGDLAVIFNVDSLWVEKSPLIAHECIMEIDAMVAC